MKFDVLPTDTLTHSLTGSLTHSPTHPPTHPLTHSLTHSLIHSLTHCMEQSPPWEASLFSTCQELPTFYGTRRFITVFTRMHNRSLSWARSIQSMLPHPTTWRSILILSSPLCLGLPSSLFISGFPTKTLYAPLLSPYMLHTPPISYFSIWSHE